MTRLDPLLPPWIAVRDPLRHSWDTVIRGLCNLPQFSVPSEFAGVTSSHLTLLSSCNFSQCENCLERFHQKKTLKYSQLFVSGHMGGWERGLREALL